MLPSLNVAADPIEQPAATDQVERESWSAIQLRIGEHEISRLYDTRLQRYRNTLYLPAFSVACWFVENWWFIFCEGARTSSRPIHLTNQMHFTWTKRHCLRGADSGLLLPRLYLFNDGRGPCAEWYEDNHDDQPHMPGRFVSHGVARLDQPATVSALSEFIDGVLDRLKPVVTQELVDLRCLWQAIKNANAEERRLCTIAASLGLNPYFESELTDNLVEFFRRELVASDTALTRDLLAAVETKDLEPQVKWVQEAEQKFSLTAETQSQSSQDMALSHEVINTTPAKFGYAAARKLRQLNSIDFMDPIESIPELASMVLKNRFVVHDHNSIPSPSIQAIVGKTHNGDYAFVGQKKSRVDSQRFGECRGLYMQLVSGSSQSRLVTRTHSWDQAASRAFAAELQLPQAAAESLLRPSIVDALRSAAPFDEVDVDDPEIGMVANRYRVSTQVVKDQIRNSA